MCDKHGQVTEQCLPRQLDHIPMFSLWSEREDIYFYDKLENGPQIMTDSRVDEWFDWM